MKKTCLIILLVVTAILKSNAQSAKFDGYWVGSINTSEGDGKKKTVVLKIVNGTAQRMSWDADTKHFTISSFAKEQTVNVRNNLIFTWLNSGGVWSETQTHLLSYINSKTLRVIWVRQVNNIKEGEDNSEWYVLGRGDLDYYSRADLTELEKRLGS
jgi:hypothetical protein